MYTVDELSISELGDGSARSLSIWQVSTGFGEYLWNTGMIYIRGYSMWASIRFENVPVANNLARYAPLDIHIRDTHLKERGLFNSLTGRGYTWS